MKKNAHIIIIVIIAMASFFGFYPIFSLFKDASAQAFGSAIFGTIFTIVLTMFLLNKQTEVSETSQSRQVVFKEKLELFNRITDILGKCFKDGKISKDERLELQFVLMGLTMLAKEETIEVFNDLLKDLFEETDPEADITVTSEQRDKLLKFAIACRRELDLDELSEKSAKFQEQKAVQLQKNLSPTLAAMGTEKRIIFSGWDEFEKAQSAKDPLKKSFMPIAENVHELIISTFKENKMQFEASYGDGTFSFSVPKDLAKSKKRTCVRFGLLNFKKDGCYIESLYKDADDELPKGAKLRKKDDPTEYFYNFSSIDDFEKVKQDIKKGVLRSYKILAM